MGPLLAIATTDYWVMITARFMTGIGVGVSSLLFLRITPLTIPSHHLFFHSMLYISAGNCSCKEQRRCIDGIKVYTSLFEANIHTDGQLAIGSETLLSYISDVIFLNVQYPSHFQ